MVAESDDDAVRTGSTVLIVEVRGNVAVVARGTADRPTGPDDGFKIRSTRRAAWTSLWSQLTSALGVEGTSLGVLIGGGGAVTVLFTVMFLARFLYLCRPSRS